jgi:branched-chain amino acid aminotransferase
MLHRYALHNDEIREATDNVLSAGQVGLLSGWGVFTTLKIVDGVLFAYERHWARMSRDAAALHVALPADSEAVRQRLSGLIEANKAYNASMRVVVVRNRGGMWAGAETGPQSDLVALTADSKKWGSEVKLTSVPQSRHAASPFAGTKILSWAMNLAWLEEAQAKGFDEVILLNERGEVAECTSANIFIAEGNRVWTPPLASGCLPGVTRQLLLSEVRCAAYPVGEKTLFLEDLEKADEVFITSTTRDLLPVGLIGTHRTPDRHDARTALQQAFSAYEANYVAGRRQLAAKH